MQPALLKRSLGKAALSTPDTPLADLSGARHAAIEPPGAGKEGRRLEAPSVVGTQSNPSECERGAQTRTRGRFALPSGVSEAAAAASLVRGP